MQVDWQVAEHLLTGNYVQRGSRSYLRNAQPMVQHIKLMSLAFKASFKILLNFHSGLGGWDILISDDFFDVGV